MIGRGRLVAALLVGAVLLTAGCHRDRAAPMMTVDPGLQRLLVTTADFPGTGWTVQDVSEKLTEPARDTGTPDPPECDYSDTVSPKSGAMALVDGEVKTEEVGAAVTNRPPGHLLADIDDFISRCHTFSISSPGVGGDARVERAEPPATGADGQVGLTMTVSMRSAAGATTPDFAEMTTTVYVAEVGDRAVICTTIGMGEKIRPNMTMLSQVFAKQVEKARAGA